MTQAALAPWGISEEDFPAGGGVEEKLAFLVGYAVLAPSSHNTQPWRFAVDGPTVVIRPDTERWLAVADPFKRELHISVGCALENLLIAAERFGFGHSVAVEEGGPGGTATVTVRFDPSRHASPFRPPELFDAIILRQTSHGPFDGRAIPPEDLDRLRKTCVDEDTVLRLTTDTGTRLKIDDLIVFADAVLMADPAYTEELARWIRERVFGTSWLVSRISSLAVRYLKLGNTVAARDSNAVLTASAFGVLCTASDTPASHIASGQAFERLSLAARSLGIDVQPMSQVLEVPDLREKLGRLIEEPNPVHCFRLGYTARTGPHTPRRPVAEVLDRAAAT